MNGYANTTSALQEKILLLQFLIHMPIIAFTNLLKMHTHEMHLIQSI